MDITEKTIGVGWSPVKKAKRIRPGLRIKRAKKAASKPAPKIGVEPKLVVEKSLAPAPMIVVIPEPKHADHSKIARVVLWVALALGAIAFGILLQAK